MPRSTTVKFASASVGVVLVAVAVVSSVGALGQRYPTAADDAADADDSFPTLASTEPLAELLQGRWRADAVVDDFSPALKPVLEGTAEDTTNEGGMESAQDAGLLATIAAALRPWITPARSALRQAVRTFFPDEPAFAIELTSALHDGVLVGTVRMYDGGHSFLRDLLLTTATTKVPPARLLRDRVSSAEDEEEHSDGSTSLRLPELPITVQCTTLTSCRATLTDRIRGATPPKSEDDAPSDNTTAPDDGAEPVELGKFHITLPSRGRKAVTRLRNGKFEFQPAGDAASFVIAGVGGGQVTVAVPTLRGALLIGSNKHGLLTVVTQATAASQESAAAVRTHRLLLRRETPNLNVDPSAGSTVGWLTGSWKHAAAYTVLMAIVVGGKFGPRLYYKWRHGIDIGPWIKSLRTGKRVPGKPLAKPGSRKKLLDEVAVLAQMEVDDTADRSREIARLRAERQQR